MDVGTVLTCTDLRALAEEAGARFSAHGNSSYCPLHHGDNPNAFHLYRSRQGHWRWHCFTRCSGECNDGDAISFYMRWQNVDFHTALAELARRAGIPVPGGRPHPAEPRQPRVGLRRGPPSVRPWERYLPPAQRGWWRPPAGPLPPNLEPAEPPAPAWQARATSFARYAQAHLWSPAGAAALNYLRQERGLEEETVIRWRLGYNPADEWDDAAHWGLPPGKRVWCGRGVVIPAWHGGALWYVKIRRPLPGDALAAAIGAGERLPRLKYSVPRGSRATLYGADSVRGLEVLLLAEGEFDTLLGWQEVGDLADVATLGAARNHLPRKRPAAFAGSPRDPGCPGRR